MLAFCIDILFSLSALIILIIYLSNYQSLSLSALIILIVYLSKYQSFSLSFSLSLLLLLVYLFI